MGNICKLCNRLAISNSVTFTGGNLLIDLPQGAYNNGCNYCIVVAQAIPAETTIAAPVYITIGGDTATLYPLNRRCCVQATAASIRSRTKYAVRVRTSATGGSFNLLGDLPCTPDNTLPSLPAPATTAPGA